MTIPVTAKAFEQALAPKDIVDFYVFISQGDYDASPPTILLLGEAIADYELALSAEAIAVGLKIVEKDGFSNKLSGNLLTVYFDIDESMHASSLFDGAGVTVPVEMLITTTAVPPRTKQRSFLVRLAKQ